MNDQGSLFDHAPRSIRDRLQPPPHDPKREAWDSLMEWEDELIAFANAAVERADRFAYTLHDLLSVAERMRGGDPSLNPEEWYASRDHARVVLSGGE